MVNFVNFIDAHTRHLRAAGRSERTVGDRELVLRRADRSMPLGLLCAATTELEAFLGHPGWSAWTRVTYFMHLRGFYSWAIAGKNPWLDWNPMEEMPRPQQPDREPWPVTDAELAEALERSDPQWRLVTLLAAYGGLRVSEIARLARSDITAEHMRVLGKGDRTELVPTHALVWAAVAGMPAGPLVHRVSGTPATGKWLSSIARRHFDRLGMPDVHLHRFRHWYGTTLQESQGDVLITQQAMRHRSLRATVGYVKVANRRVRAAVLGLPDVRGKG